MLLSIANNKKTRYKISKEGDETSNCFYVDGFRNDKQKLLFLDTVAKKTIIRTDMLARTVELRQTRWRLRSTKGY